MLRRTTRRIQAYAFWRTWAAVVRLAPRLEAESAASRASLPTKSATSTTSGWRALATFSKNNHSCTGP
jgi:hypothetical protein